MTNAITHEHDLEDHIPMLRKLDEARKRSRELRDEGVEVLIKSICPPKKDDPLPAFGDWRHVSSLVIRALLTRHDQPLGKKEDEEKRLIIIKSLINQLQKDFNLNKLAENDLSVLTAASMLRALVAQPGAVFSKTAMLCYYWIIRELYTADRNDWSIGGARAAPNGSVTAFSTSECVRAMLSFSQAMRNTGEFFAEVGKYITQKERLEGLNDVYFLNIEPNSKPLEKWVETEKERLDLSSSLKLKHLSRYLVLDLVPSDEASPSDYLKKIIDNIKNFEYKNEFAIALTEIDEYRSTEKNTERSESAHLIAMHAVEDASSRLENNIKLFNAEKNNNKYEKVKGGLDDAARKMRKLLHPVKNYLSSVLDHEMTLISLGENDCQLSELACALASYGKLTEEWEKDARFDRAVNDISKMISSRGRFPNPRPFHQRSDGGGYMTGNAVCLHAMAQLLCYVNDSEIEHELITSMVKKMLSFFQDTRASLPNDSWSSFNVMDITTELINILGVTHDNSKAEYIRGKLTKNTQKLLALANGNNLPMMLTMQLAVELVEELNKLESFEENSPLNEDINNAKNLIKESTIQSEKYPALLNKLCFQKAFSRKIRGFDGKDLKDLTSSNKGLVLGVFPTSIEDRPNGYRHLSHGTSRN